MSRENKMWAIMVYLSRNMWSRYYSPLPFEDDMWEYILRESVKTGLNTILLDVGDGVQYKSHPEISVEGAWSAERVHQEVQRCKELGIALIPKLNFSTTHDLWLGKYARMISTEEYYQVAKDLIGEVYELFEHPAFIHLGMDEENIEMQANRELVCFRQGKLLWHDMNYLMDCVCATGARPWIWSCPLFNHPEEFKANVEAKKAVISPWYYHALRREHWTPTDSRPEYVEFYFHNGPYVGMDIPFVEEDPFHATFRKVALPLLQDGFEYVPCGSVHNRCVYNHADLLEYFKENAPDDQILGYMTAPWRPTQGTEEIRQMFDESFRYMKEAMDAFYPE